MVAAWAPSSYFVRGGTSSGRTYNHYSLLATVGDTFSLPRLRYAGAAGVNSFGPDVFKRPFLGCPRSKDPLQASHAAGAQCPGGYKGIRPPPMPVELRRTVSPKDFPKERAGSSAVLVRDEAPVSAQDGRVRRHPPTGSGTKARHLFHSKLQAHQPAHLSGRTRHEISKVIGD